MRRSIVASAVAAILIHGFLLFGLRLSQPEQPLPPALPPIVVALVAAAPPPEEAAAPEAVAPPAASEAPTTPAVLPRPASDRPAKPRVGAKKRKRPVPPAPERPSPEAVPEASLPHADETAASSSSGSDSAAATPSSAAARSGSRDGRSSAPRYRHAPAPSYPPAARREHQEGVVLLNVDVGANGRPIHVAVKKSSGVESLDRAAVAAVRRWTFEPAQSSGVRVASRVEVPIRFSLSE